MELRLDCALNMSNGKGDAFMFRRFGIPLALLTVLGFLVFPAAGQESPPSGPGPALNPSDTEPSCDFYDSCIADPYSHGTYSYCVARSSNDQKCQDQVWVIIPNTPCAGGCAACGYVQRSAACHCNSADLKLTGRRTYW